MVNSVRFGVQSCGLRQLSSGSLNPHVDPIFLGTKTHVFRTNKMELLSRVYCSVFHVNGASLGHVVHVNELKAADFALATVLSTVQDVSTSSS